MTTEQLLRRNAEGSIVQPGKVSQLDEQRPTASLYVAFQGILDGIGQCPALGEIDPITDPRLRVDASRHLPSGLADGCQQLDTPLRLHHGIGFDLVFKDISLPVWNANFRHAPQDR